MIWFFTRGAAQIDVEVHRGSEPGAYILAVTYPDGAERIEQLNTAARLVTRALTIQQRLIDEGWMPASPATGKTMIPGASGVVTSGSPRPPLVAPWRPFATRSASDSRRRSDSRQTRESGVGNRESQSTV